jgi:hypothetical protein
LSGFSCAPSAPSSLTASALSSSSISVHWTDNSSNETSFSIERKTGSGGTYSVVATVAANTTSYTNTGLSSSTTYYYRVRAALGSLYSGYSNEDSATTSSAGPLPGLAAVLSGAIYIGGGGGIRVVSLSPGFYAHPNGGISRIDEQSATWRADIYYNDIPPSDIIQSNTITGTSAINAYLILIGNYEYGARVYML